MEIKTWVKYEEKYLPTPRCRKFRYRTCETYVSVELAETTMTALQKAFEDKSYLGAGLIYLFHDRLWRVAELRDICGSNDTERYATPLEAVKWWNLNGSLYFSSRYPQYPGLEEMTAKAAEDMRKYLLVDDTLFVEVAEPRYCIYTFGLGHNHGGTSLSVNYRYNENISYKRYFSALDGDKAVAEANRIAAARGDTDYVGKFTPDITVYLPECVTVDPVKDHGEGSELLNTFEALISGSSDSTEAALLCVTAASANLKGDDA